MSSSIQFAAESNPGAGGSKVPQQDVVQAGPLVTAGGLQLTLVIVVDGDGDRAAPAAKEALQAFLAGVTTSRQQDVLRVLEQGLKATADVATQATTVGEPIRIHVAAAALHNGRVYWTCRGQARVYLVQNNHHAELLTPADPSAPTENQPRPQGRVLRPGDSVVVCSDGLTQPQGLDQPAYVTDDEIAHWVKGHPPLKAVRYLLSEALGRNALDNVSAAVLQVPPSPWAALVSWPVLVVLIVILLGAIGGGGLLVSLSARTTPTPTLAPTQVSDHGLVTIGTSSGAVFTESVNANSPTVEPIFQFIPRGAVLTTGNEGANLGLWQSQLTAQDSAVIYLDGHTTVLLDQLWPEAGDASNETRLTLERGAILVDGHSSTRTFVISSTLGAAVLIAAGSPHILAVQWLPSGELDIYCIEGQCAFRSSGQLASLVNLKSAQLLPVTTAGNAAVQTLSPARLNQWLKFCAATCATAPAGTPAPGGTPTPGGASTPQATDPPVATAVSTLPPDVDFVATVSGSGSNVGFHATPGPQAGDPTFLDNGTEVYVLKSKHMTIDGIDWVLVRLLDGTKQGWMPWQSLKPQY